MHTTSPWCGGGAAYLGCGDADRFCDPIQPPPKFLRETLNFHEVFFGGGEACGDRLDDGCFHRREIVTVL